MSFDYRKLRGKIKEVCGTQEALAVKIGISKASLSDKINQKSDFSRNEIISICNALTISVKDIPDYFFAVEVKET